MNWLLAWTASIVWVWGEPLTWFIPIIAAIAVFNASGIYLLAIGVAGMITLSLFFTLKFVLGVSFYKAVHDSLWVGGLGLILIQLAGWLFYGADAYSGGGIVIAFNTIHLAMFLIFAVAGTSLGTFAWPQLMEDGWSKRQTFWIVGGLSAIGLFCGRIVSSLW